MERNATNLRDWSREDELEAWKLIYRGLKKQVSKTYQNGLYDIARFIEYGIYPRMNRDDTMLRHHAMYPEMLKGLGFRQLIHRRHCVEVGI